MASGCRFWGSGRGRSPVAVRRTRCRWRWRRGTGRLTRQRCTATSRRLGPRYGTAACLEQIFITTGCHRSERGRAPRDAARRLSALGTDYVDLWLIHWPRSRSWRRLLAGLRPRAQNGQARAIEVSNYSLAQIDELTRATGVTPSVNQVRWSPFQFDRRLLDQSRARGVELEVQYPFRAGRLDHPVLAGVAARHGKTPAQIIVRWHLQHAVAVIPKSARRERIVANADVFDIQLNEEEMSAVDALSRAVIPGNRSPVPRPIPRRTHRSCRPHAGPHPDRRRHRVRGDRDRPWPGGVCDCKSWAPEWVIRPPRGVVLLPRAAARRRLPCVTQG